METKGRVCLHSSGDMLNMFDGREESDVSIVHIVSQDARSAFDRKPVKAEDAGEDLLEQEFSRLSDYNDLPIKQEENDEDVPQSSYPMQPQFDFKVKNERMEECLPPLDPTEEKKTAGKNGPLTHKSRRSRAHRARFILSKIAKNEAEGRTDPRDAADKARYMAEIAGFEKYQTAQPEAFSRTSQAKRDRSHDVSESAPKRARASSAEDDHLHEIPVKEEENDEDVPQTSHQLHSPTEEKTTGGKDRPLTHKSRRARASRARFILSKIAKNEAEGKTRPRDAGDKARYMAEIADFEKYEAAHPEAFSRTLQAKRHRSHDVSESAHERARDAQGKARDTSFVKKANKFSEMARDSLAMALVDDFHDDGHLLAEKWKEIEAKMADMVTDRLVAMPTGPIPSFDSSFVVRGHRVIRCDDVFSRSFLTECVTKLSNRWAGLKIRLVHAREIPRRPKARIWLPKGQTDHTRVIQCLRAQNPDIHTEDWAILKAEKEMKLSQPFLLLINQRCLPQLEAVAYKLRYGIRRSTIKVFLAEPDEVLEEVDDTNKLLDDMVIDDNSLDSTPVNIDPESRTD